MATKPEIGSQSAFFLNLTTKIGWILAKVEVALPFVHQALRTRFESTQPLQRAASLHPRSLVFPHNNFCYIPRPFVYLCLAYAHVF